MYVQHQELKADLKSKKTKGIDAHRFRKHVDKIPANIRSHYRIVDQHVDKFCKHGANGKLQDRIFRKIDEALSTEMTNQDERWWTLSRSQQLLVRRSV